MVRMINGMGDRLLGMFVPKATASADPCGIATFKRFCNGRVWATGMCYPNRRCGCYNVENSTSLCN